MKKNKKGCIVGVIIVILTALLISLVVYFTLPNLLDFKKALSAPPTVIIEYPTQGEQAPAGSIITSRATATGTNPIARVELWLDGELAEQQLPSPENPAGLTTIHAAFPIKIAEGIHMLYWRAVDSEGQIGQSPPLTYIGTEHLGGSKTTVVVAEEDQTLQEIAEGLGGEPGVLVDLNPGLGETGLPGGTKVTVPGPPPPGGGEPAVGGATLVDPPQGGSIIVTNVQTLKPADPIINFGSLISVLVSNLPAAPTDLQVGLDNCIVQLVWNDRADNEQSYQVWMQAGGGPPTMIASLPARRGTGPAEYKFNSPAFGIYKFWVEAVNGLGAQPSQVEWLFNNDSTCREMLATRLEVEVLDLNPGGFSGQMYCYVSLEGNPEKRIPETKFFNDFVNILFGDFFNLEGTGTVFLIPIPADEEVTLEGKCLGNIGTDVIEFGTFSKSVPRAQWDGSRLEMQAGNVSLGFRIQPHGSVKAHGAYQYTDPDLRVPGVTSVEARTDRDPQIRAHLARNITVKWQWAGDPQDITNFVIAMGDAMEFRWANNTDREITLTLPSTCGERYLFAVAAVSEGGARSAYSSWYEYQQPRCEHYVEVIFDTFELVYSNDGSVGNCDDLELTFDIGVSSVNSVWREWGGYYGTDTDCYQTYHFTQYPFDKGAPGKQDSFTVLIEPTTSRIDIYVHFVDVDTWIVPWDWDSVCVYKTDLTMPLEDWDKYDKYFKEECIGVHRDNNKDILEGKIILNYRVRGFKAPR